MCTSRLFIVGFYHRHIQLLQNDRCLLVVGAEIYLERIGDLFAAIVGSKAKKTLVRYHGDRLLFAYDETRRMLAICVADKVSTSILEKSELIIIHRQMILHTFVFDEQFSGLPGYGSPVELKTWYDPQTVLLHMIYRGAGNEELAILDDEGRIRIYSFAAQQFRYVLHQHSRVGFDIMRWQSGRNQATETAIGMYIFARRIMSLGDRTSG